MNDSFARCPGVGRGHRRAAAREVGRPVRFEQSESLLSRRSHVERERDGLAPEQRHLVGGDHVVIGPRLRSNRLRWGRACPSRSPRGVAADRSGKVIHDHVFVAGADVVVIADHEIDGRPATSRRRSGVVVCRERQSDRSRCQRRPHGERRQLSTAAQRQAAGSGVVVVVPVVNISRMFT